MNPNNASYNTTDIDELNEKIQHRFIRDVVKPYSNSIRKNRHLPKSNYQIPKSSDFLLKPSNQIHVDQRSHLDDQRSHLDNQRSHLDNQIHQNNYTPVVRSPQTCIDIHKHVNQCPICTRIYRHYNPVLMIIIVILVLILLFLIKYCFIR